MVAKDFVGINHPQTVFLKANTTNHQRYLLNTHSICEDKSFTRYCYCIFSHYLVFLRDLRTQSDIASRVRKSHSMVLCMV